MGILILMFVGYFAIAASALFAALGVAYGALRNSFAVGTVAFRGAITGFVMGFCFGLAGWGGNAGIGVTWWGREGDDILPAAHGMFLLAALILLGAVVVRACRSKSRRKKREGGKGDIFE